MQNYISINFIYVKKRNDLFQKEVDERFGVTYHTISTYERSISLPPIDFIQPFCREYNINIDDFVNRDLSKEPEVKNDYIEPSAETIVMIEALKTAHDLEINNRNTIYNRLIDSKDGVIKILENQLKDLKRHRDALEAILNQMGKI